MQESGVSRAGSEIRAPPGRQPNVASANTRGCQRPEMVGREGTNGTTRGHPAQWWDLGTEWTTSWSRSRYFTARSNDFRKKSNGRCASLIAEGSKRAEKAHFPCRFLARGWPIVQKTSLLDGVSVAF